MDAAVGRCQAVPRAMCLVNNIDDLGDDRSGSGGSKPPFRQKQVISATVWSSVSERV